MKILILGGTQFLGRQIARACLDDGHEVTLFNRGQTNPDLFTGQAEVITGDRDGGLDILQGRSFDACIDPSGYVPRLVRDSVELMKDCVNHYTFISTISVYPEFVAGQDESANLATLEDENVEEVDETTYGGLKVLCENVAEAVMPGRVLHSRSGLIVGPYDPTDRFSYWPLRVARGGDYIAPVGPDMPVQVIDARDQADWILKCIKNGTTGIYNVTGPETNLGAVLEASSTVTGTNARPVWMSEEFLLENEVTPWLDLPMWLPEEAKTMMQVSIERAAAEGLTTRPLDDTVRDLLDWHHGDPDQMALGLKSDKETELLAKWASNH